MIVVATLFVLVPVPLVQGRKVRILGILVSKEWISVERVSGGVSSPDDWFKVDRCDVVVIVIGTSAMAPVLIEFSGNECIGLAVVFNRVENGDSIDCQCDGPAKEVRFSGHRFCSGFRVQRYAPSIATRIRLRHGNLLLPSCDTDHHGVVGYPVGFNVVKVVVPSQPEGFFEGEKVFVDRGLWVGLCIEN